MGSVKIKYNNTYILQNLDAQNQLTYTIPCNGKIMSGNLNIELDFSTPKYKYIKWEITKIKGVTSNLQASEFTLYTSGNTSYSWSGETITANLTGCSGEEITKLIDNSTSTKYCTVSGQWGTSQTGDCIIVITSPSAFDLNTYCKYGWSTANDTEARDPMSWTVSVSNDGTNYKVISTVTDFSATSSRNTSAGIWSFSGI